MTRCFVEPLAPKLSLFSYEINKRGALSNYKYPLSPMTLAERLKNFQDRGFRAETATVLVLIEEALHSLFTSFTDTFVLFGGATLVLFYGSQRHSGDIDLAWRSGTGVRTGSLGNQHNCR